MMYEQKIKINLNAAYNSKEIFYSTNLQLGNKQKYHNNKNSLVYKSLCLAVNSTCGFAFLCMQDTKVVVILVLKINAPNQNHRVGYANALILSF